MKRRLLTLAALTGVAMFAQEAPPKGAMAFQQVTVMGAPDAGPMMFRMIGGDAMHGATVTGKPMSATEQHHSLQVLADGTRIENTETNTFVRDEQGRTRIEHDAAGSGHVMIHDPIAGYSIMLDPANKIAHKMTKMPALPDALPPPPPEHAGHGAHMTMVTRNTGGPDVMYKHMEMDLPEPVKEDLGTQTINGVLAQGTRSTMTIPAGKMGNDRPIQVVSERWYSNELQTVVKSSNHDPRFGDTTYELTNIDRAVPSAALFQIPAGYTIDESDHGFVLAPHPPEPPK